MGKEQANPNVNITCVLRDLFSGEILQKTETRNTVVDDGLEQLEKVSGNVSADYFDDIAIGTDSTAVANDQSALIAQQDKQQATNTHTGGKMQWVYTFTFASGVSVNIEEAGVFNGASVMMNRGLTGTIAVDSTKTLEVTVTLNFTRP